jgi:hypothetical protein
LFDGVSPLAPETRGKATAMLWAMLDTHQIGRQCRAGKAMLDTHQVTTLLGNAGHPSFAKAVRRLCEGWTPIKSGKCWTPIKAPPGQMLNTHQGTTWANAGHPSSHHLGPLSVSELGGCPILGELGGCPLLGVGWVSKNGMQERDGCPRTGREWAALGELGGCPRTGG